MFSWYLLPTSLLYHLSRTYWFYLNQSVPTDACEAPWTRLRCTRVFWAESSLLISLWKTWLYWLAAAFKVSLCSTEDKWKPAGPPGDSPYLFFPLISSRKITSKSKHIKAAFWNHLLNIIYHMPEAGPCFPVTTRRINLPRSFHQTTSYHSIGSLALLLIGLRCRSSTGRKKEKRVLLMLWHHLNEATQNNLQNRQGWNVNTSNPFKSKKMVNVVKHENLLDWKGKKVKEHI